jgi:hypothetical protein
LEASRLATPPPGGPRPPPSCASRVSCSGTLEAATIIAAHRWDDSDVADIQAYTRVIASLLRSRARSTRRRLDVVAREVVGR